jgi:hypothetical protein
MKKRDRQGDLLASDIIRVGETPDAIYPERFLRSITLSAAHSSLAWVSQTSI